LTGTSASSAGDGDPGVAFLARGTDTPSHPGLPAPLHQLRVRVELGGRVVLAQRSHHLEHGVERAGVIPPFLDDMLPPTLTVVVASGLRDRAQWISANANGSVDVRRAVFARRLIAIVVFGGKHVRDGKVDESHGDFSPEGVVDRHPLR
jgi:hypothetical protein